jgi:hypothetical protein
MGIRRHHTRAVAAATAALFAVTAAVTAAPAEAATPKTVLVLMTDNAIVFRGGGAETANGVTTLRPGRYHFHVVSRSGGHALQLMSLRDGYTVEQAQKDFPDAFEGDVAAVQRVDNGLDFRGGASARPKHPGDMVVKLPAGDLLAVDQNGDAFAELDVTGKKRGKASAPHDGSFTAFTYGWGVSGSPPASGTAEFANQSDQPHFLVLQHVKSSTTNAQVRKFIKSDAQGNPPWLLKGSADSGVLSPGRSQLVTYDLPPGKYLVACFWPDYFTGMPHVFMGMWKLVTLD